MLLIFYRMKYPAAQHLERHHEFTEKSPDLSFSLWLVAYAKFCRSKGQTTLAQHPRE